MDSDYELQRLRAYASVFHKVWIEIEFKDGKFVSLKKIDMGKDFKNSIALRGLHLGPDFYASRWNDRAYVPRENWWFNGHLLCNTDTRWTDRGLDILYYMFSKTNLQLKNINKTIILNKRDYAWCKKDQTYPYPWNSAKLPIEFHTVPMQKPLSFYGGKEWNDILIPIPEHWNIWSETELCRKINEKIPKIVFRGTLTGPFTDLRNDRIMAYNKCKDIPWADVKLTDWTSRERVIQENGILHIKYPPLPIQLGSKLTMIEQSKYEILLYIDGHVASSRKAWHLCSGSIVLCIKSSSQCPQQWFDSEWEACSYPFTITETTTHFECGIDDLVVAAEYILNLTKEIKSNIRKNCLTKASKTFSKENMIEVIKNAILVC